MKYEIDSIDDVLKEKESEIKKADDNSVTFTNDEAKQVLTIMLEDSARWKLYSYFPCACEVVSSQPMLIDSTIQTAAPAVPELNQKAINDVVNKVYRNIVKDWRYDANLLQICRKAKFDLTTVRDIVDGVVKTMKSEVKSNGTSGVSKSLARSMERVRKSLSIPEEETLTKSNIELDTLRKTGIPYPERVYAFLKY
ncbi:hypothetical protein CCP3SC1AL1_320023 [Gammaproteobacteria bacterium]